MPRIIEEQVSAISNISAQDLWEQIYQQENDSNEEMSRKESEFFDKTLPEQYNAAVAIAKKEQEGGSVSYSDAPTKSSDKLAEFDYVVQLAPDMDQDQQHNHFEEILFNIVESFCKEMNKLGYNIDPDENFKYEWSVIS